MMKKILKVLSGTFLFAFALMSVACSDEENEPLPESPPVNETGSILFTHLELIYKGDDGGTGQSDNWFLKMYTDMPINESGNPIGKGQLMQLSLNTRLNEEQTPDPTLIAGSYTARDVRESEGFDFPAGTFNPGYASSLSLPNGSVEIPDHTFFGDLPEGSTQYTPDYLSYGSLTVEVQTDSVKVAGTLSGQQFLKRKFIFKGLIPEVTDYVEPSVPNSTLTEDITDFSTLTQTRLTDRGDSYVLGDESYRLFEVYLAEPGVNLENHLPAGTGKALRIDLFVEWSADASEGIPAGTYTAVKRYGGGISREDIVPFRMVTGQPDNFRLPSGTWYQSFNDGAWGDTYARIDDGTVTVDRTADGGHKITLDLYDCNTPARRVYGTWESDKPFPYIISDY